MRNLATISLVAVAALGLTAGIATAVAPSPRAESILLVRETEPTDDHGSFSTEPTLDPTASPSPEPTATAEPGDDNGGATAEPGD
ncbi:MAG: hypothetical protein WCK58_09360, partial [Chloroflexota bacterium]